MFCWKSRFSRPCYCRKAFYAGVASRRAEQYTKRVLFGPGVIAAYKLERDVAKSPRVIIDHNLTSEADHQDLCRIKMDSDGFRFIDVFYRLTGEGRAVIATMLGEGREPLESPAAEFDRVRKFLIAELAEQKDISIREKYIWLAGQFNRAIQEYFEPGRIDPIVF